MRLDVYLTEQQHYPSRNRAKNAIKKGAININGQTITKPSHTIKPTDNITIQKNSNYPQGYYKLQKIQQQTQLIKPNQTIIDIGSSAGGYLLFATETTNNNASIHAIEYSSDFIPQLQTITKAHPCITLHQENAYNIHLTKLPPADIILNDLTAEPLESITALLHILPRLKQGGKILQVIKHPKNQNPQTLQQIIQTLQEQNLTITHTIPSHKKETYIIAEKIHHKDNKQYNKQDNNPQHITKKIQQIS